MPSAAQFAAGLVNALDPEEYAALTRLGVDDVAVYNGSLSEWAADPTLPLVTGKEHGEAFMTGTADRGTARLTGIAPQFLVDDLEIAIAYYRDRLGFALDFTYDSFYAGVSRDGLAIHLKQASKPAGDRVHRRQNEHLDAYVAVVGVEALHQELQIRGARITKPIGKRPWACIDFYVEDADGYVLCFSEQTA